MAVEAYGESPKVAADFADVAMVGLANTAVVVAVATLKILVVAVASNEQTVASWRVQHNKELSPSELQCALRSFAGLRQRAAGRGCVHEAPFVFAAAVEGQKGLHTYFERDTSIRWRTGLASASSLAMVP